MVQPIQDCQVLLARGMSWSARECLISAGVRPTLTDIASLDEAVNAYQVALFTAAALGAALV